MIQISGASAKEKELLGKVAESALSFMGAKDAALDLSFVGRERIRALNGQLELRNKLLSETFGRFLSDEIVRQLLDTPDGLALGVRLRF